MKRTLLLSLLLIFMLGAKAQVVYNPNVAIKPLVSMSVYKVEMTPQATIVTIRLRNQNQLTPFYIESKNLYIQKTGEFEAYKLVKSENVPFAPKKHIFSFKDEILEFTLHFPPMPKPVKYFDIKVEGDSKRFYLQGVILDHDLNSEITRGFRAAQQGDINKSLEAFINVAEMDMYFEFGLAYFNVIYILAEQKRWAEAGEWYKKFQERFFYDKKIHQNYLEGMGIIQHLEEGR
ncbi:MAG: hypothetical protein KAH17_01755 [Bacteroidales bacterium]|nr:hypothetical protein [Bacteroidales bacterium]